MDFDNKSKRIYNPAIKIIRRKDALGICAVSILFLALMIWFIFGTVEHVITVPGVFANEGYLREVHQPVSGVITSIDVATGEFVKKGQVIAKIYPTDGQNLPDLEYMKQHSNDILSTVQGVVVEEGIKQWSFADISTCLLYIQESEDSDIDYVYCFVDDSVAEAIIKDEYFDNKIDMEVRIAPAGYPRDVFGVIPGTISDIFEETKDIFDIRESFSSITDNEEDLETIQQGYPVLIHSGNKSLKDYSFKIHLGDRCEVQIVTEKKHPFEIIFDID